MTWPNFIVGEIGNLTQECEGGLFPEASQFLLSFGACALSGKIQTVSANRVLVLALAKGDYISAPLADSLRFGNGSHVLPS